VIDQYGDRDTRASILINLINMTEWLGRSAALARLGVRRETLYAYVSRGRIAARPDPGDPRCSLYRAADIAALVGRRVRGRRHAAIAASAIAWGEPSIATSISTIDDGRLIYRGRDAVALAESATLEDVAALLWEQPGIAFPANAAGVGDDAFVALAAVAATSLHSLGRSPKRLRADAATVVGVLATALGAGAADRPVHERLAEGWSLRGEGADLIRRALVLLADHELNASTFAVRVAASTGASISASLLAGLSALSGPRHGGAGQRAIEFVAEAKRIGAEQAVERRLAREEPLPGFGHPLYPDGDPRAAALLARFTPKPIFTALRDAVMEASGRVPNVDFALAAVTSTFRVSGDAAFRLFALGRSIGWVAHALEQASAGQLIRPRAVYTGGFGIG
jgi:citrate synthase